MTAGVVIVGAGQGGAQLATSLRDQGYTDAITLIGDEAHPPYHRPPLSKDFLDRGPVPESELWIRRREYYADKHIELITDTAVTSILRTERAVRLSSGGVVRYDHLVLATGARNRRLKATPQPPRNVYYLRTMDDAQGLKQVVDTVRNVLIIGAGFIGMEFASAASRHGADVVVVEAADRIMARAVSGDISRYFTDRHTSSGTTLLCDTKVDEFTITSDRRVTQALIGSKFQDVDMLLVGIGIVPNAEIAASAGLHVSNGIVVNSDLLTSDPAISAIGDCARYPRAELNGLTRLESVQNATDQARYVARRICGSSGADTGYGDVPWFWSHQLGDKLQIAGLAQPSDSTLLLGDSSGGRFSICRLRDGLLVAVESVNSPGDHLASRKLLEAGSCITEEQLSAPGFSLRSAARESRSHEPRLERMTA